MLTALLAFLALVALLAVFAAIYLRMPKFGALPAGERLARVLASPNYRDGAFQNLIPTPHGSDDGSGFLSTMLDFVRPRERLFPGGPIPSVATGLGGLGEGSLVWFGHSGFLARLGGRNFLFDPSLGPNASPLWWTTKAFPGTQAYGPADLPAIDYLLISHDHWDHLDHPTVTALRGKDPLVVSPLGVGAHFERWGFGPDRLAEGDWWDSFEPEPGLRITIIPSRHFSGRGLSWNQSLWGGFLVEAGGLRILYGGDGGYLPQYAEFGRRIGPVDLALMECGQYDRRWKNIHMTPEESVRAAGELGARAAMPVHSGKFRIANHPWDEPFIRFAAAVGQTPMRLVTPRIGQVVDLADIDQEFDEWWVGVD
jgi:L-ascorbate metabolism protein UlaG (beta-lactamase superfamily)